MYDAIAYGLSNITRSIPRELLVRAFSKSNVYQYGDMYSLEALIEHNVIRNIVMMDCNCVGGQMAEIPIGGLQHVEITGGKVVRIPLSMTGNRHIQAALAIEQGTSSGGGLSMFGMHSGINSYGTGNVYLISPNTIMYTDNTISANSHLRCMLGNDENLQNMSPRAYPTFGLLCELATKGYIYTQINIAIGDGSTREGSVNTYIRSALDEYSDSWTTYRELLDEKWTRISVMQDKKLHQRLTRFSF